jgi:hypothetical protein
MGLVGAVILWVGPVGAIERLPDCIMQRALPHIAEVREMASVHLHDLAAYLHLHPPPHAILSPLFWTGGDGMETARLLHRSRFPNPYRILAPDLPRPELVLREIRLNCPSLDIDLVAAPGLGTE